MKKPSIITIFIILGVVSLIFMILYGANQILESILNSDLPRPNRQQ